MQPVSEHALASGPRSQAPVSAEYVNIAPVAARALVFENDWLHIASCNRFQKPLAERGLSALAD